MHQCLSQIRDLAEGVRACSLPSSPSLSTHGHGESVREFFDKALQLHLLRVGRTLPNA